MKVYKSFNEIRGNLKKLPGKYYKNLKENWSVLNIGEISKSCHFWENIV